MRLTQPRAVYRFRKKRPSTRSGTVHNPKYQDWFKGLHILEPSFREFSTSAKIKSIARDLNFKHPEILQSMLIFKQPKIGGAVPPHQDSTFLYTSPVSATGLWIPLEDCTENNGCLYFYPGSHRCKYLIFLTSPQLLLYPEDSSALKFPMGLQWQLSWPARSTHRSSPTPSTTSQWSFQPVRQNLAMFSFQGTLVLIHGSVLHKSGPNTSEKSRLAYTVHMIEGEADYSKDNW